MSYAKRFGLAALFCAVVVLAAAYPLRAFGSEAAQPEPAQPEPAQLEASYEIDAPQGYGATLESPLADAGDPGAQIGQAAEGDKGDKAAEGDKADEAAEADNGDAASQAPLAASALNAQGAHPLVSVQADASGSCGSNLTWSLTAGALTISGSGAMTDFSSDTLPGWNAHQGKITSVIVGNGVTSIGSRAFMNAYNLVQVTVPASVTTVGEAAFYQCVSLKSIDLPGVATIGSGAFAECDLTSFSAPKLKELGNYSLQGITVDVFTVPATLASIEPDSLFRNRIGSFSVAAGNKAYTAKDGVLYADGGKTLFAYPGARSGALAIPSGVTKVGDEACVGSAITSVSFPSSVTALGSSAFQECANLTSVSLPDAITSADYFTFYECTGLKSVKFGKGLKSTSYEMFENCSSLVSIDFGGLEELDARAFASCTSLESIDVPATVKSIGNGAFGCNSYDVPSLKSAVLRGVTEIPYQSFLNQNKLTSATFSSQLTHIYRAAFVGCTSLAAVTLPASTKFVHEWAFEKTTKITCLNKKLEAFGDNGLQEQETLRIACTSNYAEAFKVLGLVNEQRAKAGLSRLYMDSSLLEAAMTRAGETAVLFSHTRPDSTSCFSADDKMIAENIAYGQPNAAGVMNSWMNSSGHKANILSSDATAIGIGCVKVDGTYYWAQCFGANELATDCAQPKARSYKQTVQAAVRTFTEASTSKTGISWSFDSDDEYTFEYRVALAKSSIPAGGKTKASVAVVNPGSKTAVALEGVDGSTWKSSSSAASVDSSGAVKGLQAGSAKIIWQGKFKSAKSNVKVTYKGKALTVKGYTYLTTSPTTARLTGAPNKKKLTVPATVKDAGKQYKVTEVANGAFKASKKAKSIVIGSNVASIGKKTFSKSFKVKSLVIGAGVKTLGASSFAPLKKLKSVTVKSRLLTMSGVKGSLKGSKVAKVVVKVGKKADNKSYAKKYAQFFTAQNAGRKAVVKG